MLQQYGVAPSPQLLTWLTVVGAGFVAFAGLGGLGSAAGAAKVLPARRAMIARMLVNCILIGLMVLNRERKGNMMISRRDGVQDE